MTQQQILLYNFKDDERTQQIRRYLNRKRILFRNVQPPEYAKPLGVLLELPGFEGSHPFNLGYSFSEEMMVFYGFEQNDIWEFLSFFRSEGLKGVALKAMVTPVNQHWNSIRLHDELSLEHRTLH